MYTIAWSKRALKSLSRITHKDVRKIYFAVQTLRRWPECREIMKLTNHDYGYRLRVSRYRIFFEINNLTRTIVIEDVKKRDERTY